MPPAMVEIAPMDPAHQHAQHCLRAYFARPDCNTATLLGYAERLGNGAVFKRLGFLAENLGASPELIDALSPSVAIISVGASARGSAPYLLQARATRLLFHP